MRPYPLTRRLQRAPQGGQLSLFDRFEAVDPINSDQVPVSSTTRTKSFSAIPAISLPSGESKPPTKRQQSGKCKRPGTARVPTDARLLVSRKAAAEMLTISIRKVDYLIADGRLLTRRIDNRVLIPTEEIRKFARSDRPRRKVG